MQSLKFFKQRSAVRSAREGVQQGHGRELLVFALKCLQKLLALDLLCNQTGNNCSIFSVSGGSSARSALAAQRVPYTAPSESLTGMLT